MSSSRSLTERRVDDERDDGETQVTVGSAGRLARQSRVAAAAAARPAVHHHHRHPRYLFNTFTVAQNTQTARQTTHTHTPV